MSNRLFYALQAVGFAPHDSVCPTGVGGCEVVGSGTHPSGFVTAHGVQSVGITTTFNLEQVFELGQLELYENIEGIPDIEVTLQKLLDGHPLLYHLATPTATSPTLAGRANDRCFMALNLYPDTNDNASGIANQGVGLSGLYTSALTYTLPVDGNFTEDLTLVGNNKQWVAGGLTHFVPTEFTGSDEPLSITSSGGVARRENILMGDGCSMDNNGVITGTSGSIWPTEMEGIDSNGHNLLSGSSYAAHIQNVTISADLGREDLFELGRRGPYHRFVSFPIEVTCAIEMTTQEGDLIDALADPPSGSNLTNQKIFIWIEEGTQINLGTKNKLTSITYGGGDASGGSVAVTLNYSNFNTLTVTHPQDPAGQ